MKTKKDKKKYNSRYYLAHKEKLSDNSKRYYDRNKEKIIGRVEEYCQRHSRKIKNYKRRYYQSNKKKILERCAMRQQANKLRCDSEIIIPKHKKCCECDKNKPSSFFHKDRCNKDGLSIRCKECCKKRKRNYYAKNKGRILEYYLQNKKKILSRKKEYRRTHRREINLYIRNKKKNDVNFKIAQNLRCRIYHAIKSQSATKGKHMSDLLGCSVAQFKKHIEGQFLHGMSWDNYGYGDDKWHMDHIIPCAYFDLTKPEEQKKCFHYTNFCPLWQPDNLTKSSFYQGECIRKIRV